MTSLEKEVERYNRKLIEFVEAEDLASIEFMSVFMARSEYELLGYNLNYDGIENWSEKLQEEFAKKKLQYQLEIQKKIFKLALEYVKKGKRGFYPYKPPKDQKILSQIRKKLEKEGGI